MRFFGESAGEKGQARAPSLIAPLGAAARASCAALIIGPLNTAGGLNRSQAHSLDMAILVVGLPPVFFFIALFFFVYRRRFAWRGNPNAKSPSDLDTDSS